jgi:hypothetical protein
MRLNFKNIGGIILTVIGIGLIAWGTYGLYIFETIGLLPIIFGVEAVVVGLSTVFSKREKIVKKRPSKK